MVPLIPLSYSLAEQAAAPFYSPASACVLIDKLECIDESLYSCTAQDPDPALSEQEICIKTDRQ